MRAPCPIIIKRGSTLVLDCTLRQRGTAVPIVGWQIDCWLRGPGGRLVQQLAVTITDAAAGAYRLGATPEQTAAWPVGDLAGDIRYRDDAGRVMHTADFTVGVVEARTTPQP